MSVDIEKLMIGDEVEPAAYVTNLSTWAPFAFLQAPPVPRS
ncbi:hypothetical protein T190_16990 [Sinorhizobium meliloti CCBAU 01290]|nr:hypothetical protein T190_16990 [Sinorhizobium meliloti CCBAU 01290]